jgi:hypothetical protein
MLVRTTVLALVAANALYFAWSHELLAPLGLRPDTSREPQRLAQQIKPEALRVAQTASDAPAATAEAPPPTEPEAPAAVATPSCVHAGPFNVAQAEALRQTLTAAQLPPGAWALDNVGTPTRWIVYMGKYTDPEVLDKKRAELRAMRVETAPIGQAALAPGLSLGVFTSSAGAYEQLAQLTRRGVRTARVVPEQPEHAALQLRLPAADDALRAQVQPLIDKPLIPC